MVSADAVGGAGGVGAHCDVVDVEEPVIGLRELDPGDVPHGLVFVVPAHCELAIMFTPQVKHKHDKDQGVLRHGVVEWCGPAQGQDVEAQHQHGVELARSVPLARSPGVQPLGKLIVVGHDVIPERKLANGEVAEDVPRPQWMWKRDQSHW